MTFLQRPVSAALLAIALVVLVVAVVPSVRRRRDEVFSQ
jgi:putative tricarboxylic transport membrane protein